MLQDFQRNLAAVLLGSLLLTTAVTPAGAASSSPHTGPFVPSFAKKAPPAPAQDTKKGKEQAKGTPKPAAAKPGQIAAVVPLAKGAGAKGKPVPEKQDNKQVVAPKAKPGAGKPGAIVAAKPATPPKPSAKTEANAEAKTDTKAPGLKVAQAPSVAPPPLKPSFPSAATYTRQPVHASLPVPVAKPAYVAAMAPRPGFFQAPAPQESVKAAFPMGLSSRPSFTPAIAVTPDLDSMLSRRSYWSCVPYVQEVSAVRLSGDGWRWWDNASGRYDRGRSPRPGSVLVFKRSRDLDRGHVAVVRQIIDRRTIRVDHANWGQGSQKGRIDQGVLIRDVSAGNDWSMTRVWYSPINDLGSTTYPTYGFVYPAQAQAHASREG